MEQVSKQKPPKNYLGWAIFTLIVFWPLGIPAIVNAAKVDKYWLAGYEQEAISAARRAKNWSLLIPRFVLLSLVVSFLYGLISSL
ncbi:MAG: CD225/dispanin family protein [Tidjanibacter sp.]|nr:CD225/dispanin family protein [Tidjanibacter sp.]